MLGFIRDIGVEAGSLVRDMGVGAAKTILGNNLPEERKGVIIGNGLWAAGVGVASYAMNISEQITERVGHAVTASGGVDSRMLQEFAMSHDMSPEDAMRALEAFGQCMGYLSGGLKYAAIFLLLRAVSNIAYGKYETRREKKLEASKLTQDWSGI